jgi:hypothetical protein
MDSAIYTGTVRHRRFAERRRELRHRVALAYLDLDELPALDAAVGGRLLSPRPGIVRFRRRDYHGDDRVPLADALRTLVARRTGTAPAGPIRLLAHLRSFGHCFNPVSFYYCYAPGGERLETIVAEVTNTPWGERHSYVLVPGEPIGSEPTGATLRGTVAKALHVSPFMDLDQRYVWAARPPGPRLWLHMESHQHGHRVFDATLRLQRQPFDRRHLTWMAARYPLATQRVLGLIYIHAAALWLQGVRVRPHPGVRP